jgi:hypothetical protein
MLRRIAALLLQVCRASLLPHTDLSESGQEIARRSDIDQLRQGRGGTDTPACGQTPKTK